MILNLATDLIENILSRLPLKSLRSVRLTCRKWNALSKTQSFTKLHIAKVAAATREGESQMIATMYHNVYLMSVFVVNEDHPSTERKGKLTCLNKQVKISRLFHCDGLLLCILKHKSIVVWNPYSGQTRWIETNSESENDTDDESENNTEDESEYEMEVKHKYALGYVSSNKNQSFRHHKIVKFRDDLDQRNKVLWYKIYDFDSDSWRNPDWCLVSGEFGVSINGNTYWCARERNKYVVDHLICFDFTRERFGPLLPLPFRAGTDATLSCVGDEKIAVLFQEPEPYRM